MAFISYFLWYPGALIFAGGGIEGMKIVFMVDMVLGPLLTLIIYDVKKSNKELLRDVSIIAIFQLSCLTAGMAIVYQERPLAVVYIEKEDYFQIYNHQDFGSEDANASALENFEGSYPKLLSEALPKETAEGNSDDIIRYYVDRAFQKNKIRFDLYQNLPADSAQLKTLINATEAEQSLACIDRPIKVFAQKGTICFNPETQRFSDYRADEASGADAGLNL